MPRKKQAPKRSGATPAKSNGLQEYILESALADAPDFEAERKQHLRELIKERSRHGAGSSKSIAFRKELDGKWFFCKAAQGPRDYMEDEFQVVVSSLRQTPTEADKVRTSSKSKRARRPRQSSQRSTEENGSEGDDSVPKSDVSLFGVFDGHGGELCSRFLRDQLLQLVRLHPAFPHDIPRALKESFKTADAVVNAISRETDNAFQDGSTATVAVLDHSQKKLWVANVGDSRCAIISGSRNKNKGEALTRDHSCDLRDEAKRVQSLGGKVISCDGVKRVQGVLAVSRAIGDTCLKPFVTSEPEIREVDISEGEFRYLCLASDGIWDEVDEDEVSNILIEHDVKIGATQIVDLAADRGSEDNMTFMAIRLDAPLVSGSDCASPKEQETGKQAAPKKKRRTK